ncbi:TetR/AcrR family transcriptional regulator [Streptomyces genisteinicus]|uniref:TetR/AcrR family transcriptional regulator n=1 Tax=Streptomyces genisteinicus TaxID=2768068 RepID=A0A7H0HPS5_9ACTN|nr:TetR/AcrR family transcriptional regulator [Streptomyces genisteinicus]QNP62541.1 TetR/AcrR family transcriptional regulator [Streptomyces genisteinicus]
MGRVSPSPLRREPVQRRSADRLARILDACAALLDECGYEELSTRAVAERAGVPIGSVYRFFGNKRALVDALGHRNLDRYAERIAARLGPPGPPGAAEWRAVVDVVLDEYLDMKRTVAGFTLIDFGAQVPLGAPVSGVNSEVPDRLAALLAARLGRAVDEDLRRAVLVAVEAADALLQLAFRADPSGDERIVAETRRLVGAYLAQVLDP